MKKRKLLALAAVMSCLSMGVYGSYAYFTAEEETVNVITAGNVKIDLIETTVPEDGGEPVAASDLDGVMPGRRISRIVQVENTGDNPAYIRVRVDKVISLAEGKEGEPDLSLVTCDLNTEQWLDGNDGYYYYQDSLEVGRRTEPLFEEVAFDVSMGNMYQGSVAQLEIQAQATQVVHNGESVMDAKGWPDDKE